MRQSASHESPQAERDALMRMAIEGAARGIRQEPDRERFLERSLVDAVIRAWELASPGGIASPNVRLAVPGWDPEPGHTDLVLGLLGDAEPTVIAELKVLDVDQTVWDAVKLVSIAERHPTIGHAYLIVATTPKRWREAEVAELYAPPDVDTPEGVREWEVRDLFDRWARSWRYLSMAAVAARAISWGGYGRVS